MGAVRRLLGARAKTDPPSCPGRDGPTISGCAKLQVDKLTAASAKQRAVGSTSMDLDMRELAINTAKSEVGLYGSRRSIQGAMCQVAVVAAVRPNFEPIKKGGGAQPSCLGRTAQLRKQQGRMLTLELRPTAR
ncbi:unnamed protein product [Prorocentrum cordatum]|uniref:Uncharacterized protein n=1 Tax=Prorocentrum cordatum TaxID=2364126 RepID=A0ABN9PWN5_9DINO|nr:unnamed protein product [Polarella glacialis]